MIREVQIDVNEKGGDKAAVSIKKLAEALQDAAAGAELSSSTMKGLGSDLQKLKQYADATTGSLDKLGKSSGLKSLQTSFGGITDAIELLTMEVQDLHVSFKTSTDNMAKSSANLENNVVKAVEDVSDSLERAAARARIFGYQTDDAAKRSGKFTRAIGDTSGAARGQTRDFAALARIAGPIPMMYGMIAANVFALQQAYRVLQTGEQVNVLNRLGVAMTAVSGAPTQLLARALQESTGNALSFEVAMQKATKATQLGATSSELEKLGKVAQRSAAAGFTSMEDATERLINGIYKLDAAALSGAGITVDLNSAYKKYADQLNATTSGLNLNSQSLSRSQKQQALLNEVTEISNKNLGKLDDTLAASGWDKFGANVSSTTSRLASLISKGLTPVINTLSELLDLSSRAGNIGDDIQLFQDGLKRADPNSTGFINSFKTILEQDQKLLENLKAAEQAKAQAMKDIQESNKKLGMGQGGFAGGLRDEMTQMASSYAKLGWNVMPDDASKKALEDWVAQSRALEKAKKEIEDTTTAQRQLNAAYKQMYEMAQGTTMAQFFEVDRSPIKGLGDDIYRIKEGSQGVVLALSEVKNYAGEGRDAIKEAVASMSDRSKTTAGLQAANSAFAQMNFLATNHRELWQAIIKEQGLSVNEISKLRNQMNLLNQATKVYDFNGEAALQNAQARYDLAKKTGNAKQVSQLKDKQEAQNLNAQIKQQQESLALVEKGSAEYDNILRDINAMKAAKLDRETAALTKEVTTVAKTTKTIVDLTEKINLVNNRTLDDYRYSIAMKQVELNLNKQNLDQYRGKKDKQNEYNQALLNEAQIRRDMAFMQKREMDLQTAKAAQQDRQLFDVSKTKTEMDTLQRDILDNTLAINREIANSVLASVPLNKQVIADLNSDIELARAKIEELKQERERGYANATTNLLGGTGQSTDGMGADAKAQQDFINNQQGYAEALSNLRAINSEATDVATNLGNVMNAVMLYADGALDATAAAAAGMQLLGSVMNMASKQQTSAIDMAIKAEQQRDGKSEESKNKIKKLEAEKIKIQQEAAKKQILISTAQAVMQAATSVPYPWSIPLMVAAAAAGAMAFSQASNPTNPSMDMGGSGETGYLKLGDRDSKIDVSQQANSGELAYARGEKGIGSAQNFIPRAEGGITLPGVGYVYGEHGVEVATPRTAGRVTANDQLVSGSATREVNIHVSTMDAQSFIDFAQNNKEAFRGAVESALNEEGSTLVR